MIKTYEKDIGNVFVFQDCDTVAALYLKDAKEWYKNLTGLTNDELYRYEDIEIVGMDKKTRK